MNHEPTGEPVEIWFDAVDLGEEVRQKLWLIMSADMDRVLERFYSAVLDSSIGYMFDNFDLGYLRKRQREHWHMIVLHGIDAEYDNRLRTMHVVHKRIGLDNGRYITAYMFIMNLFQEAILRNAPGPKEAHRLISALQVIVADDISRALEIFFQEDTTTD